MSHIVHNLQKGRWVYIEEPTAKDGDFLREEFPFFHPIVLEDSLLPTRHSEMDISDKYLFLSLTIPTRLEYGKRSSNFEISLFLTKDSVITITYRKGGYLEEQLASIPPQNPHTVMYYILDNLYRESERVVKDIGTAIQHIDDQILATKSTSMIREIAILQRNIVYFITTLESTIPHFTALEESDIRFEKTSMKEYWNDLRDRLIAQRDVLNDYESLLSKLSAAHETFVTHQTNHIINVLTVFSAIFLPLNLIAGIYGMNMKIIPLADNPYGFFILFGAMIGVGILLLSYFKWKRWI